MSILLGLALRLPLRLLRHRRLLFFLLLLLLASLPLGWHRWQTRRQGVEKSQHLQVVADLQSDSSDRITGFHISRGCTASSDCDSLQTGKDDDNNNDNNNNKDKAPPFVEWDWLSWLPSELPLPSLKGRLVAFAGPLVLREPPASSSLLPSEPHYTLHIVTRVLSNITTSTTTTTTTNISESESMPSMIYQQPLECCLGGDNLHAPRCARANTKVQHTELYASHWCQFPRSTVDSFLKSWHPAEELQITFRHRPGHVVRYDRKFLNLTIHLPLYLPRPQIVYRDGNAKESLAVATHVPALRLGDVSKVNLTEQPANNQPNNQVQQASEWFLFHSQYAELERFVVYFEREEELAWLEPTVRKWSRKPVTFVFWPYGFPDGFQEADADPWLSMHMLVTHLQPFTYAWILRRGQSWNQYLAWNHRPDEQKASPLFGRQQHLRVPSVGWRPRQHQETDLHLNMDDMIPSGCQPVFEYCLRYYQKHTVSGSIGETMLYHIPTTPHLQMDLSSTSGAVQVEAQDMAVVHLLRPVTDENTALNKVDLNIDDISHAWLKLLQQAIQQASNGNHSWCSNNLSN